MDKLTELATQLDYLKLLRRQRVITSAVYNKKKSGLERKMETLRATLEAEKRSREVQKAFLKKQAEKKKKKEEALANLFRKKNKPIFDVIISEEPFETLTDLRHAIANRPEARILSGKLDMIVPGGLSSNEFMLFFRVQSDNLLVKPGDRLLAFVPSKVKAEKLLQMFRDGVDPCVFSPICKRLVSKLENATGESKKRLSRRLHLMNELKVQYEMGVPENDMEQVCKSSGFKVILRDRLNKQTIETYNEKGKEGTILLTNSRENHVDEGILVTDDVVPITFKEMKEKWLYYLNHKNEIQATVQNGFENGIPRRLHLLNEGFKLYDPEQDIYENMNKVVKNYRFNATKYPEVNTFIKAGRIINSWPCNINDVEPDTHLDMPKAYTQFNKCNYYMGFLGMIHQWRSGSFDRDFIRSHIGLYRVHVRSGNDMTMKLGLVGTHVLPSPEILYFMDKGVVFDIDAGVYGSRFDFEFPEEMLLKKRYAIWSGRLGSERTNSTFTFSGSKVWAGHLAHTYGETNVSYWDESNMISVLVPNIATYTTHHVLAFITSYVRIQMMEAMESVGIENVNRVVMDGIYFRGSIPKSLEWFKPKEMVDHLYSVAWYEPFTMNIEWGAPWINKTTLLSGQGGAGKTYKVVNDPCFHKILFVSPQHVLGCAIKKQYGINYTTIHKLVGVDCSPYLTDHAMPSVIFIDEVTQIESSWIDKAISMYSESLVILAGDMNEKQWFQCRNGTPGVGYSKIWKPNCDIVDIPGDRRSRDEALKSLKLNLRDIMTKHFIDGDEGEEYVVRAWGRKNLNIIPFDDACKLFVKGDVWIAGTHKTNDKLIEHGIVSGWYKQGGHVQFEGDWSEQGYKQRGSFTIHAFQGRTVESGKVFISVFDTFEYAMLYTAISRAVNFHQLVFVG